MAGGKTCRPELDLAHGDHCELVQRLDLVVREGRSWLEADDAHADGDTFSQPFDERKPHAKEQGLTSRGCSRPPS